MSNLNVWTSAGMKGARNFSSKNDFFRVILPLFFANKMNSIGGALIIFFKERKTAKFRNRYFKTAENIEKYL